MIVIVKKIKKWLQNLVQTQQKKKKKKKIHNVLRKQYQALPQVTRYSFWYCGMLIMIITIMRW